VSGNAVKSQLTTDPPGGVDYTQVLVGAPGGKSSNVFYGVMGVLIGYFFLYPIINEGVVYLGWTMRGHPGDFPGFFTSAQGFNQIEGMVGAFLSLAAFIGLVALVMRVLHRRDSVWTSSVQPGVRWRYLIVVVLISVVVLNAVYWVTTGRTDFHWQPQAQAWVWLVVIVLLAPLQAAGEEYLFRGYLMQVIGLLTKRRWVVVLVSGAVFAAMHGEQNVALIADRFAFGCVMGALVVLTGGLEAAIAAHAVNNVFAFGYAALSGGVSQSHDLTAVSWPVAVSNIVAYVVVGVLAWRVGVVMKVATRTPGER